MKVCDEKADVVALNLLPPQDDEVLCSPHHEAHEHPAEQAVNVVQLLDGDGDPHRIDAGLYQNFLLLVPGYDNRVQKQLRRLLDLNLRLVVSLHLLTGEVLEAHGGLQGPLDTQQVGLQGIRHV